MGSLIFLIVFFSSHIKAHPYKRLKLTHQNAWDRLAESFEKEILSYFEMANESSINDRAVINLVFSIGVVSFDWISPDISRTALAGCKVNNKPILFFYWCSLIIYFHRHHFLFCHSNADGSIHPLIGVIVSIYKLFKIDLQFLNGISLTAMAISKHGFGCINQDSIHPGYSQASGCFSLPWMQSPAYFHFHHEERY